jgi:serine/threonine protein kinase
MKSPVCSPEAAWERFYRARDLRLKREVAIKILPEGFSHDTDRLSRFQREAEVLASLNHPTSRPFTIWKKPMAHVTLFLNLWVANCLIGLDCAAFPQLLTKCERDRT